ncbi:MAG TPA: hypothetical protein VFD46_14895 [Chryseolinea sp.]|nr:hypothetical protein [Chryseolinea sp.]
MHAIVKDYKTEEDISNLIEGFKSRTLPSVYWTHEAHLITGLWFNYNYSELEAICFLRSGIISYNIGSGGENTPEKGYHETLTLFWCRILNKFVKENEGLTLVDLCDKFLSSEWSSKELPLKYYSREILFSLQARATWVGPNLRNL